MTTNLEENSEKATIINGVVLTGKAVNRLKEFQSNNNEIIGSIREYMADAICIMAINMDYSRDKEDQEKLKRTIADLSYVRDYFDDLRKP